MPTRVPPNRRVLRAWSVVRARGRDLAGVPVAGVRWLRSRVGSTRRMLVVLAVLVVAGVAGVASLFLLLPVGLPGEPRPSSVAQTSRIYAADGSLLTTLHGAINREPVPLRDLPSDVTDAVVASEDARFFEHHGIDLRGIARALSADVASGSAAQGGSTITQQYAKTAYVGSERTLWRKIREARVAHRLEQELSKYEILERYLNTVYFGRGAYGIQAAAKAWFGKPASELSAGEAALLVGLIPAPARYSPDDDAAAAEARRRTVIERMRAVGRLDAARAEHALAEQPTIVPLEEEQDVRYGWFVDAVRRYLFNRYGVDRVLTGGFDVHTTLDPSVQQAAEAAIAGALPDPADPYAALVSVEPGTGYVRALVGGRDWGSERFNIAIQGRRQPGSIFKPFVLVAALEQGIRPDSTYRAPRSVCLDGWRPACRVHNFGRRGFGTITLETATIHSVNTVYAQLILDIEPRRVVDVARRMGIPGPDTLLPGRPGCNPHGKRTCGTRLRPLPALALGAQEVTPLEMASAYGTFAAGGTYRQPKLVTEIVDRTGRVLERGPSKPVQAIAPDIAGEATRILEGVVSRGTGQVADIGDGVAGKTGTTQDHRDAWFAGYTKHLATAIWVGYRDTNHPLQDVHGVRRVTGGTIPAEIWADFMQTGDVSVRETVAAQPAVVGGELRYRLELANAGPWPAADVELADELPAGGRLVSATPTRGSCGERRDTLVCRVDDLGPGETAAVDVVVEPREVGTFEHAAAISMADPDPDPADNVVAREVAVAPASDVAIDADLPDDGRRVGDDVTLRLTARNHGPSDARGVELRAALPSGWALGQHQDRDVACAAERSEVVCRVGDLLDGRRAVVEVDLVPGVAGAAEVAVRATAADADPVPGNNRTAAETVVDPVADVGVAIEDAPPEIRAGDRLAYRVVVHNAGPSPATHVELEGALPSSHLELAVASPSQGSCAPAGRSDFTCALGSLAAGGSATVDVAAAPREPGDARLSAKIEAAEHDPEDDNDGHEATTTVVAVADLAVGVRAPAFLETGRDGTWELAVTNHGPSPATDAGVAVTVPPGLRLSDADGARCRHVGDGLECRLGTIDPHTTATATLVLEADAPGAADVALAAVAAEPDPAVANGRVSSTTTVFRAPFRHAEGPGGGWFARVSAGFGSRDG